MGDETIILKTDGLDKLIKSLHGKTPTIRVGVLGSKASRAAPAGSQENPNNAEVGATHEFGSPTEGVPQRSFLRIPISDNLDKKLTESGAFDPDTLSKVVKQGTVTPWMKKIAIIAENIVSEAFDTGGFGKWPRWKNKKYKNNTGQILVDTAQLRNSITSEVKE